MDFSLISTWAIFGSRFDYPLNLVYQIGFLEGVYCVALSLALSWIIFTYLIPFLKAAVSNLGKGERLKKTKNEKGQ